MSSSFLFLDKARALAPDATSFLQLKALMLALWIWSFKKRLGNMAMERLLALCRGSSPNRCAVGRYLSAGFLAQCKHRHQASGGTDMTRLTRKKLLAMDAPVRYVGRSAKAKKPCDNTSKLRFFGPLTLRRNEQVAISGVFRLLGF